MIFRNSYVSQVNKLRCVCVLCFSYPEKLLASSYLTKMKSKRNIFILVVNWVPCIYIKV